MLLSVFGFSLFSCNGMFYHPSSRVYDDPKTHGFEYSDTFIQSLSGNRIHYRYFPKQNNEIDNKGLLVLFHGNAENLTTHYWQFNWITEFGYDFLIFDYSGYGQSGGTTNKENCYLDGLSLLNHVSKTFEKQTNQKLIIAGQSLGGAILASVFPAWENRQMADLVIFDCAFHAYRAIAKDAASRSIIFWPLQPLVNLLIDENRSPKTAIPKISPTPLLIVTCEEDQVIPTKFSDAIFKLAKEPKWIWRFQACGHTGAFNNNKPDNRIKLISFLDNLGK